jgi:hypothetical protein
MPKLPQVGSQRQMAVLLMRLDSFRRLALLALAPGTADHSSLCVQEDRREVAYERKLHWGTRTGKIRDSQIRDSQ